MSTPTRPSLSIDDVRKVAKLSRLAIPDDQLEDYRSRLSAVLGYVQRLRELDLKNLEPLTTLSPPVNRLGEDEPGPTLPTQALMDMAPDRMPPFVRVPKVLGEGGGA